jgi:RNA polymerase sigma-70 factor (ECF subfamily)
MICSIDYPVSIAPLPSSGDPLQAGRRLAATERDARFRSVVLPHLADAYALARRLTGNRIDSEDVVQEACVRSLRGMGNFSEGNARAWVLTIVRHTAYDWLSRNRPAAMMQVDSIEEVCDRMHAPMSDTPETELIAHHEKTSLRNAIAALPARFREPLLLRGTHGLSYRGIAAATGVPIGTVMSRLSRARQQITVMIGVRNPA